MSWLRLGEAYSKAGRYAAAFKALERARELNPADWIASYFIGDVQRLMGAYEEAIKAFESILEGRPQELGVLHSLGQTYLELGRFELSTAFLARAETSFVSAIRVTLNLLDASSGFRRVAWKTVADSLYQLSTLSAFYDEDAVKEVVATIASLVIEHSRKGLVDATPQLLSDCMVEQTLSVRPLDVCICFTEEHSTFELEEETGKSGDCCADHVRGRASQTTADHR